MTNEAFDTLELVYGPKLFPVLPGAKFPAVDGWPEWEQGYAGAENAGINCDGLLAIDVDAKEGRQGNESLAALELSTGAAAHVTQRTPTGGAT